MSGIAVLLALLVLAYLGSILVSGRTIRGFGLPSGAEYVLLGVVLGPHLLGVVERSAVSGFEPVMIVAVSWVAMLTGLSYRHVGRRTARPARLLFGVLTATAIGAAVATAAFHTLARVGVLSLAEQRFGAFGAGMVVSETTRHMIRWVAERHGARGPLSDFLADVARGSALVPIVALSLLCATLSHEGMFLPLGARLGITFGVGALLGIVAAVLLGREFRQNESWGILIGTSLLGMGIAVRLGLSPLGTSFALGLTLSLVSRHQLDIRALVQPTEKPVMLPVLLIAGIYVDFHVIRSFWPLFVAALLARLAAELVRGLLLNVLVRPARSVGPLIGVSLISTGPITIAVALSLNARAPGVLSTAILSLAVVGVVFGEFIGPALLRRALERAGETHHDDVPDSLHPLASNPPPPVSEGGRPHQTQGPG
jgi:hypothetical protein